ncbi:MAG: B12-binding domain-containing radical SAM protein [Phycisphaerae bacterium]|nr:B12-binding domain-containing radical SAM protein [Phycisphaerae bacterium]
MTMRVVLLRPPRYVWPFNSATSAFWQPLGLLALSAAVLRELPEVAVEVWDCPARRWGWRTLERLLAERPIDVLGIGEETVSAHEALRAAALVKQLHPGCLVVAGGVYFAHAVDPTLRSGLVDVIVRGEGEVTFCRLLEAAQDRADWAGIAGLAFLDEAGQGVRTPPRPLIADMDDLPFPAYDLVDMNDYGRTSRNHPNLVSIEHSRGCIDSCAFCILWKHMGTSANGDGSLRSCYRSKTAQRSFQEVRWLYHRFGRRTFGWVDPTFNVDPAWSDAWAEAMLASDLTDARGRARTLHTAWVRADGIVRDHKLGVLDKLVRAGLRQVMIGVERDDDEGLAVLGKHHNGAEVCREAFAILRREYPAVYTIGTVIFGLPGDRMGDLRRLAGWQYELGMDYCFLMPLTPNPGTAFADSGGPAGTAALARYNFHTPVMPTAALDLRQLESIYWRLMFRPSPRRWVTTGRQLLLERDRRKRRVTMALLARGTGIAVRSLLRRAAYPASKEPALHSRKPPWYDD